MIEGRPIATFEHSVSEEQVTKFFDAVAWRLPARPLIPPTVATIFRKGEFLALQELEIPVHRVLHGEQKYVFHKELEAGRIYRGETLLNSHYERSGGSGAMAFFIFQTNLSDSTGALCVECHTTVIVRG